jgi:hypothetical protein
MSAEQLLGVIASYIALLIIVFKMISSHNRSVSTRFEAGNIKMTKMEKDIERMDKAVECKANKELVENQLQNINDKLTEIKKLIEKGGK